MPHFLYTQPRGGGILVLSRATYLSILWGLSMIRILRPPPSPPLERGMVLEYMYMYMSFLSYLPNYVILHTVQYFPRIV